MKAKLTIFAGLLIASMGVAAALELPLPKKGEDVVGKVFTIKALRGDDFRSIGKRYELGFHEMVEANWGVNPWRTPAGTTVTIAQRFVLPPVRKGIVINLAELRLYYFKPGSDRVWTAPIGIGREGWNTPTAKGKVIALEKDPIWNVPKSIKQHVFKTKGIMLPNKVMPGPENPLGKHSLRLSISGYLIHGTNAPGGYGIGERVSSGCIRMHPKDIEKLFSMVKAGTPVTIINHAHKVGWEDGQLFLESHRPLSDQPGRLDMREVVRGETKSRFVRINWDVANDVAKKKVGIPTPIGRKAF